MRRAIQPFPLRRDRSDTSSSTKISIMPKQWNLKQTVQCVNCPWRKDSDPSNILNYDEQQHEDLISTIVDDDIYDPYRPLKFMACHNSTDTGTDLECVGWLYNQMGCNNIALRIRMLACGNIEDIKTHGKQFKNFQRTLPRNRRKKK